MKSFRSRRALSPIFATLILIAIAVIAGIVVYMFTSGTIASMTGGGTAGQEKVAIQGVDVATGVVYAQVTAGGPVQFTSAIIKDNQGNIVGTPVDLSASTPQAIGDGLVSYSITAAIPATPGTYTVTLTSQAGGSFVSPAFVIG